MRLRTRVQQRPLLKIPSGAVMLSVVKPSARVVGYSGVRVRAEVLRDGVPVWTSLPVGEYPTSGPSRVELAIGNNPLAYGPDDEGRTWSIEGGTRRELRAGVEAAARRVAAEQVARLRSEDARVFAR